MNLRRQLLLVSLLTLVLPWGGCQFIRETESALREGQQQMLAGTAQAIADSLSQFPYEFITEGGGGRLYLHPLQHAPLLDGYADDWTIAAGALENLRGKDGIIRYVAGAWQQHLYLYVDARDARKVYRPATGTARPRRYDHVALTSVGGDGRQTVFRFAAEAPGEIVASREADGRVERDTRVTAYWLDTAAGYQLEIRLPRNLAGARLGITVNDTDDASTAGVESASFGGGPPGPLAGVSPVLQSVAAGYVQPGLRLIITDKDGWRLAQAGSVSSSGGPQAAPSSGWMRIAYDLLLEPGAEAALAEPSPNGREQQGYISGALGGQAASRWFRSPDTGRAVVSVAQPIWSGTVQTGAIVLQQGTDAILSLTNQALTRLIVLTLAVTVVVAAVLIGYASWLSLRIRALSSAALEALDEKRLKSALPSALAGDEVGDLSRSFSSVLRQLGIYNDYLQSLASKLSHELRTPLTIVRSSLENLEHEKLSAEAIEYTERAREGTERLQKILNAMSEASRTEELIDNVEPEHFDLARILEPTVAAYADAWPERRFRFENRADAGGVNGAPELIIQMLDKLVDNAVDFSNSGDTIVVSLEREAETVVLAVTNPGPPLPEELREGLFRSMVSFRKNDAGKHLGLGLYIARLIAEGHEGSIDAVNTGEGVSFRVRLPLSAPRRPVQKPR
ncbi:MAG TPA: ATP-binding protein [Rhodocyclaceae bacterium]